MATKRPIVLTFLDHYLPGFKAGGPIRTVLHMVEQLSDEFDFQIVTADRDLGDTQPYEGITVNAWNRVGSAQVFYRSPGASGWRALLSDRRVREHDLTYLSGVFSPTSTLRPLLYRRLAKLGSTPVLVPPRGELSPGALRIRRPKKIAFLTLARLAGLYRNVWWHCSNDEEAAEVRKYFRCPPNRIFVARDLSGLASAPPTPRRRSERLRIAFLSRISPSKNLDGALKILAMVSRPVEFQIIGPLEDREYWNTCETLISQLPTNVVVKYAGEIQPHQVEPTLRPFDLFLFPTHGENYGHVIREALSAGVPALLSDCTPWRGLEAKNAGADLPLDDLTRFARWIDGFAALDDARRHRMREGAHALGNDAATAAVNLEANRQMLLTALGRG